LTSTDGDEEQNKAAKRKGQLLPASTSDLALHHHPQIDRIF
jgi:hypothetical protein